MKDGFFKVACACPDVRVAACTDNADNVISTLAAAEALGARLVLFPELCLTGASCGDLFFSDTLLTSARDALLRVLRETSHTDTIIIVGFPLVVNEKIYNCAALCQKGHVLGVAPKSLLGASDERYFTSFCSDGVTEIELCGDTVPFGTDIVFSCSDMPLLKIGIEIGTECFCPVSPSVSLCSAGATLIVNPFAKPYLVGDGNYTAATLTSISARVNCAYMLAGAADGESTTDGVYGGEAYIYENGKRLAHRAPLSDASRLTVTDIDLSLIASERRKNTSLFCDTDDALVIVDFSIKPRLTRLTRSISPTPFLPEGEDISARCETILAMQAHGLARRITAAHAKKVVLGVSGGLDSTLALLVAAGAVDLLGRERSDVISVTMPCFGTTARTKSNAEILARELGTSFRCVEIGASVKQHLADIGHDGHSTDVTYENAQARERTQVLMDVANMEGGFVLGTGDLSELVLGWATYNGDHMSMYGVNAGLPKTLIRHVVATFSENARGEGKTALADVLCDILDTPVSPELLPADKDGNIAQRTEDLVGPYRLHDFYIFYMLRYGFAPDKLFRMAKQAFRGEYSDEELLKWLKNLIRRFFAQQFKRSCLPDGVKIGTVGVSPRGDLMMPSDALCDEWMRIADGIKIKKKLF